MKTRYDEKGKYFTQIVTKDAIPSLIQTLMHRIRGNIHVRIGERIKDEIDRTTQFLAVTDARVYSLQGAKLYETEFILINRDHIIWLIPEEETEETNEGGGGGAE
jgi:hypothetical protein